MTRLEALQLFADAVRCAEPAIRRIYPENLITDALRSLDLALDAIDAKPEIDRLADDLVAEIDEATRRLQKP